MAVVGGGDAEKDGFSEINITPFTDVLLVLLIIFLITGSSITAPSHDISLPEVLTREKAENTHVVIDVDPKGSIFVGNEALTARDLEPHLARLAQARKTDRVIVNADADTPYGAVMVAMDAARSAGLPNIALATGVSPRAEEGGAAGEASKVKVKVAP